jgi:hypothetical protein
MRPRPRFRLAAPLLLLAACLAAGFLLAPHAALAQNDHTDGYLSISPDGRCMVLKSHDGSLLAIYGRRRGLRNNDHVRLEGTLVPGGACGAPGGFKITAVQTIWADDRHKSTYYDHLKDGSFDAWADRQGRQ